MFRDKDLHPIHPGEILREDFLLPLKLTPKKLAENIKVKPQIIQDLIAEKPI